MNKTKILFSLVLFALLGQTVQAAADEKNYLSVAPFYIEPGDVVTVDLNLINELPICAYQTDLILPEGMSVTYEVEDGETYMDVYVAPDRTSTDSRKAHIVDASSMKDGSVRIVCYSPKNTAFVGNQGAVATISIKVDDGLKADVYELKLQNTEVTMKETLTAYHPVNFSAAVPVGETYGNKLTLAGKYTDEAIMVLNTELTKRDNISVIDMTGVTAYDGLVNVVNNPNAIVYTSAKLGVTNENNVVINGVCENLVITDGYPFETTSDFTIVNGVYKRTLEAGKYGTVVLPFEIDEATSAAYEFYELKTSGEDYLHFEIVEYPTAGMPYLYINKGDVPATNFTAKPSKVGSVVGESENIGGWKMIATYIPIVITDAAVLDKTYYISSNKIKNATKKLKISAFRAYLTGPSFNETFTSSAMSVGIRLGKSTEIVPVEAVVDDIMYDISGREVVYPVRGLYIKNGKKFYNNQK